MGERVNIQYSVDIGDLGKEVSRLIGEAYSSFPRHTVTLEKVPDKDNVLSLQTIQMIEEIREQLGEIDIRLGDAVGLINGYISYKSQLIAHDEVSAQVDRDRETADSQNGMDAAAAATFSALQEQIKDFQAET